MRTTLNIPDDVYGILRSIANTRGVPVGEVMVSLVRRALMMEAHPQQGDIFPCFTVPEGAAPITLEQTLAAEDELRRLTCWISMS